MQNKAAVPLSVDFPGWVQRQLLSFYNAPNLNIERQNSLAGVRTCYETLSDLLMCSVACVLT